MAREGDWQGGVAGKIWDVNGDETQHHFEERHKVIRCMILREMHVSTAPRAGIEKRRVRPHAKSYSHVMLTLCNTTVQKQSQEYGMLFGLVVQDLPMSHQPNKD